VVARVHAASWRQAYRGLLPQQYLDALSVEARTKTWAKAFSQLPGQTPTSLVAELDAQIIGFAGVGPNRDDDTDAARPTGAPATSTKVTAGQQTAQRRRSGVATCDWTRPEFRSH
jgi:hypothetical protein